MSKSNTAIQTAEIIAFPRSKTVKTKSAEEIQTRIFEKKLITVQDAMSFLIPQIFESYFSMGFTEVDTRKSKMFVELMRSMMFDHFGIYHPMDDFFAKHAKKIDKVIVDENDEYINEGAEEAYS